MKTAAKFDDMSDEVLMCRALRHPWEPRYTEVTRINRKKALVMYLECERCKSTVELVLLPTTHERYRRRMKYSDSYLVKGLKDWGGRAVLNENVALELFERVSER